MRTAAYTAYLLERTVGLKSLHKSTAPASPISFQARSSCADNKEGGKSRGKVVPKASCHSYLCQCACTRQRSAFGLSRAPSQALQRRHRRSQTRSPRRRYFLQLRGAARKQKTQSRLASEFHCVLAVGMDVVSNNEGAQKAAGLRIGNRHLTCLIAAQQHAGQLRAATRNHTCRL